MSDRLTRRALAGLALIAACGGEPVDPDNLVPVASVTLQPATPVLGVGATAALIATARSGDGTLLPGREITFTSSDPSVATVDGDGVVTGVAAGTTDITATSETRSATVPLSVSDVRVAAVTVSPDAADVAVNAERTLAAEAFDAGAAPLLDRVFAWTSSNPAIATVTSVGVVRGIAPGEVTITASSEGQSAAAAIRVFLPPVASVDVSPATGTVGLGDSLQLTAALADAEGQPITGRRVTWESSNTVVASVSSSGLVRGLAPGDVAITARVEGQSDAAALGVTLRFSSVSAGADFTCGVTPVGTVYCWGRNAGGSLGNNSLLNRATPAAVSLPFGVRFDSVSAGQDHACGLARDGTVYCWGSNTSGHLGTGDTDARLTATAVVAPLGAPAVRYTNVSAAALFTCARTTTDLVNCWGLNFDGQLGNAENAGVSTPNPRPLEVQGGPFDVVSALRGHACALTDVGFAVCWGDNASGQLGRGGGPTSPGDFLPAQISGSRRFSVIAAGDGHACAIGLLDSRADCWGSNANGQLGTTLGGGATLSASRVAVSGSRTFATISAGQALTCAVTRTAAGFCWGSNEFGQLGIGSDAAQPAPAQPRAVAGGLAFRAIDAGVAHACGVTTDNVAYCWGRPNDGFNLDANALGTGSPAVTRAPAQVSGQ
ncbi:MAG: Ig-like domain-containing protein [Gemmatimonadales bacterium]